MHKLLLSILVLFGFSPAVTVMVIREAERGAIELSNWDEKEALQLWRLAVFSQSQRML